MSGCLGGEETKIGTLRSIHKVVAVCKLCQGEREKVRKLRVGEWVCFWTEGMLISYLIGQLIDYIVNWVKVSRMVFRDVLILTPQIVFWYRYWGLPKPISRSDTVLCLSYKVQTDERHHCLQCVANATANTQSSLNTGYKGSAGAKNSQRKYSCYLLPSFVLQSS